MEKRGMRWSWIEEGISPGLLKNVTPEGFRARGWNVYYRFSVSQPVFCPNLGIFEKFL